MGTTLDKRLLGNSSSIKCIRRLPKKSVEKASESHMRSLQNSDSDLKNFAYSKHPNEKIKVSMSSSFEKISGIELDKKL
ncbi:hypothetical protein YC2023_122208 [Brassica napus]